ncbi:MAG: bifunctional transaldolase/phosoglucose isomerase [Anaerolineales bacterium]
MRVNPLNRIQEFGQSIWLDFIRRGLLESGELKRLIDEDGLRGVTVNPSILEKAIAGSQDYDEAIHSLALEGYSAPEIYEMLAVEDVQMAADLFQDLYRKSDGRHGFVSLEVSPYLAHNTEKTIDEARRFWSELNRPNVMIKVPGTTEGIAAIEKLIEEGININVTLLFGLPRYREIAGAYLRGLRARMLEGKPLYHINSVASFFVSRIDVLVDPILEDAIRSGGTRALTAARLHGQVAIASAKVAYQIFNEVFLGEDFQELVDEGARKQRLLWASTSTKNPKFSDVKYVEALIGQDTVNTIPLETLNAYRDHGSPKPRLAEDPEMAHKELDELSQVGIDLDWVTKQLEDEGVQKFVKSYDHLISALEGKRKSILGTPVDHQIIDLGVYQPGLEKRLEILSKEKFISRLWSKDASLWEDNHTVQNQIRNSLGWLHVAEKMEENLGDLMDFAREVREDGFRHVVHLGMGGSSLAPVVLKQILGISNNGLPYSVLDTTAPDKILELESFLPLTDTLFVVASKSGTTAETRALADHFYEHVSSLLGKPAGRNFVAISDPGSPLVDFAREKGYRRIFLNFADIGGRYSALSYFGLVPAALMGIDLADLIGRSLQMSQACDACVPIADNPGALLGATLGELYLQGHDKVTFLMPASLRELGKWLEQLLAESTGKDGKGLLPVLNEPPGDPAGYAGDRLFVCFKLKGENEDDLDEYIEIIRHDGSPMITIVLDDRMDLGQEFFRWEFATAIAGAIIGINAFDQPNVQESKDNTNRILEALRHDGGLPYEEPKLVDGSIKVYANGSADSVGEALTEFLAQAKQGDYVALMAYLTEITRTSRALQDLRMQLHQFTHLATTVGYGPRFLHSTGQYHKGGPDTGLFIQLTADQDHDLQVPNQPYTFGTFLRAQAIGDYQALQKHNRRIIRIHLGDDIHWGLGRLTQALKVAESASRP